MADTTHHLPTVYRPAQLAETSFEEKERMAETFAASGLFGVKTKQQALALILIGDAEGMPPALAVQEFDIIEGKPARKAERIQARFQLCGGKITWKSYTNECVEALFEHPQGSPVTVKWTIEDAKRVTFFKRDRDGSGGKWYSLAEKHTWKSFPRAMLRSRVISEGARACYPAYAVVTLCTDEALDMGEVESDVIVEDVDQRPDDERITPRGPFLKGARAEKAVNAVIAAMDSASTPQELEAVWRDAQALNVSQNRRDGLAEYHERNLERLQSGGVASVEITEEVSSPFEELKQAGIECLALEPEARQEAFEVWAGSLTPDKLEACTDEQREELRALYKNIKAEIAG